MSSSKQESPPPYDETYLDSLVALTGTLRSFKELVIELSAIDLTGSDYFGDDLKNAGVDDEGRLVESFQLSHGHYKVEPTTEPTIDDASVLDTAVLLSRPDGGRRYYLNVTNVLNGLITLTYFEDKPDDKGANGKDYNPLKRLQLTRESGRGIGIHISEMATVERLTSGIIAVRAAGRLQPDNEKPCNCM